ncbi:MAG: metallophosphoesterase [Pseudomonadota bacterium]
MEIHGFRPASCTKHKLGLFALVMFTLAHLSDVHLGPLPPITWHQLLSKRFTGYANWKLNREHTHQGEVLSGLIDHIKQRSPDHIALTGDIINLGLNDEIANARAWLEAFGPPQQVSLVCGNHDAYVPGSLEQAFENWQPYLSGDDGSPIKSALDYPVVRRRGKISFILCNSACATPVFFATGCFDRHQTDGLAKILDQEVAQRQCRVILIHHPPVDGQTRFQKRLVGAQYFRNAVKKSGAELILHGHTHVDSLAKIEGPNGSVPVLGVPAGGQSPGGKRTAARYNLLSIEDEGDKKWDISQQQYGYGEDFTGIKKIGETRLISES